MTRVFALVVLSGVVGCRKAEKVPAATPHVVTVDGALHAVSCGGVTAIFSGHTDLPPGSPRSYGIESLAFRFADGAQVGFTPAGQLFFTDWSFDVFSPDCERVALLADHYGPIHVVKTAELREYLTGRRKPLEVSAPTVGQGAPVLGQVQWVARDAFEFVASVNGGAEALRAHVAGPVELKSLFFAATAPSGIRRIEGGYELVH